MHNDTIKLLKYIEDYCGFCQIGLHKLLQRQLGLNRLAYTITDTESVKDQTSRLKLAIPF